MERSKGYRLLGVVSGAHSQQSGKGCIGGDEKLTAQASSPSKPVVLCRDGDRRTMLPRNHHGLEGHPRGCQCKGPWPRCLGQRLVAGEPAQTSQGASGTSTVRQEQAGSVSRAQLGLLDMEREGQKGKMDFLLIGSMELEVSFNKMI